MLNSESKLLGIDNTGFQDTETEILKGSKSENNFSLVQLKNELADGTNPIEFLKSPLSDDPDKPFTGGVRKKTLDSSLSTSTGSISKKSSSKAKHNGNLKSPNGEYIPIWMSNTKEGEKSLSSYGSVYPLQDNSESDDSFTIDIAPPLPPRGSQQHRPLERSHAFPVVPPIVPRHQKPKPTQQKPEDTFGFEMIDIDEQLNPNPDMFLITNCAPLATPETDGSLSESVITTPKKTFLPNQNTPRHVRSKTIGCDNYITTVLATKAKESLKKSLPSQDHTLESDLNLHKPLSRQTEEEISSTKSTPIHRSLSRAQSNASDKPHTPIHVTLKRTQSLKVDPTETHRPHPRVLSRVSAQSPPVCPPTPTHHARRSRANMEFMRPPNLKTFDRTTPGFKLEGQEIVTSPEIRHADIRSIDTLDGWASTSAGDTSEGFIPDHVELSKITLPINEIIQLTKSPSDTTNHVDLTEKVSSASNNIDTRSPDVRSNDGRAGLDYRSRELRVDLSPTSLEGINAATAGGKSLVGSTSSSGVLLPLRHLSATRLPSIPEQRGGSRHQTNTVIDLDHEEPLPPCK